MSDHRFAAALEPVSNLIGVAGASCRLVRMSAAQAGTA